MKANEKRFEYLDFLRIFSTLAVLTLHCICDHFYNHQLYNTPLWKLLGYINELCRTGVPLFFMMSGYLLLKNDIPDIKTFYKKRFLKIGIPFLIYDVFYYLLSVKQNGLSPSLLNFFKELFNNGSYYHLWFVYTILFIYLLIPFLRMIVSKCSLNSAFLLLLISVFQTTIRPFLNTLFNGKFYIFITDDGFMGYIGYVIAGYILGTFCLRKRTQAIIFILGFLSFAIFPLWNMKSALETGNFIFNGGYTLNHYLEAAAIFLLFKATFKRSNKFITSLSGISFTAYLIHAGVIELLKLYNFNMSLQAEIIILSTLTVILSFIWAYCEKLLKGMFRIAKKNNIN